MTKILSIAAREFLETVRTRAFFLGVILMPMLIVGVVFGTTYIMRVTDRESSPTRTIAVVDHTNQLFPVLERLVESYNEQSPQRRIHVQPAEPDASLPVDQAPPTTVDAVRDGLIYAYLVIPPGAIDGLGAVQLGRKDAQHLLATLLTGLVNDAVQTVRFDRANLGVPREEITRLQQPLAVTNVDVSTGQAAAEGPASIFIPLIFMFVLLTATMGISHGLLTSVLEEKSSRIVEVLLSAVSPTQLMAGKIIGMVAVGLVMVSIWLLAGLMAARNQTWLAGALSPWRLAIVMAYFIPGFLLTAATLGAIGAACNTLKEAQSMASPLSLLNTVLLLLWLPISQRPDSLLAVIMSFVPPITPFVMILRICIDPTIPVWQLIATQVLLWSSALGMIWFSARIFRVGLLMYGKAPTLREMIHWARYA